MRVAVIGLGEAGSLYATGFAAKGWTVTGFDPADNLTPAEVTRYQEVAGTWPARRTGGRGAGGRSGPQPDRR